MTSVFIWHYQHRSRRGDQGLRGLPRHRRDGYNYLCGGVIPHAQTQYAQQENRWYDFFNGNEATEEEVDFHDDADRW